MQSAPPKTRRPARTASAPPNPRRCRNVQLQRGLRVRLVLGRSSVHGLGVFAAERAARNDFVGEYVGELVTDDEAEIRGKMYDTVSVSYLYDATQTVVVDSTRLGSRIKFVNHSKEKANLYPRSVRIGGDLRIGLFAKKPLEPGQELFFDYGYSMEGWRN